MIFLARPNQTLEDHLIGVSQLSRDFADKIGFPYTGEILGLCHDLGKYNQLFLDKIENRTNDLVDHSTFGSQYLWNNLFQSSNIQSSLIKESLGIISLSHHNTHGIIDALCSRIKDDNEFVDNPLLSRINKEISYQDVLKNIEPGVISKIKSLESGVNNEWFKFLKNQPTRFEISMLLKFLYSCLIDADRLDAARANNLGNSGKKSWNELIGIVEYYMISNPKFSIDSEVNKIRNLIKEECKRASLLKSFATYLLTVPPGAGKTLASLLFALYHAKINRLDRIIFSIPFINIIDQNLAVLMEVFNECKEVVLAHHSNISNELVSGEDYSSRYKYEDNWDSQIIITTSVQLNNTIFKGAASLRRLHNLAKSVIICDEIQSIPLKTTYLFNNGMNFINKHCGSTTLLCSATQPLLDNATFKDNGMIISGDLINKKSSTLITQKMTRVKIINQSHIPLNNLKIAEKLIQITESSTNVLCILNTKKAAERVFEDCRSLNKNGIVVHVLTADMCIAHRLAVLSEIRQNLTNKTPMIVVSTQLMDAGVDVDFMCVVRSLADLPSITQSFGRCNRNGLFEYGSCYIIYAIEENLHAMPDLLISQSIARELLGNRKEVVIDEDLISQHYRKLYSHPTTKDKLYYQVTVSDSITIGSNISEILDRNTAILKKVKKNQVAPNVAINQSFSTAAKLFNYIDNDDITVIVQYNQEATRFIEQLENNQDQYMIKKIMKELHKYSVTMYNTKKNCELLKNQTIELIPESGILILNENAYDKNGFGLKLE